eukprot:TRINITY_DN4261_c1_g1_i1.p1 TRINITY_DN4261_c1_g1~~TRINITY_DN4261_c1_g1_i1.p1  ORF type:complete len:186 (+),score=8.48 TRINITY_DN4261_c1_g1_i1:68-625(+)
MSVLSYGNLAFDDHEVGIGSYVSYSRTWPSWGPPAEEATANMDPVPCRRRNPMPLSGSRRDASGPWSVGSEGHELGRCQGPCRDVRSGRGCTWSTKCKRCHCPHPEVSSTSIRGKKSRGTRLMARMHAEGLDQEQQVSYLFSNGQHAFHQGWQERGFHEWQEHGFAMSGASSSWQTGHTGSSFSL